MLFSGVYVILIQVSRNYLDSSSLNSYKFILLWFFIFLLSVVWSDDKRDSFLRIVQMLPFISFGYYIAFLSARIKNHLVIKKFIIFSAIISSLLLIYFLFKYQELRSKEIIDFLNIYNTCAEACIVGFPLLFIFHSNSKKKREKSILFFFLLLLFAGILISTSRAALLSLFLLYIYIYIPKLVDLFLKPNGKKIVSFFLSISVIILVTIAITSFNQFSPLRNKIEERLSFINNVQELNQNSHDVSSREKSLFSIKEAISDNPVFGHGIGGYKNYSEVSIYMPHNWLASSWVSAGIFGVGGILLIFFKSWKNSRTLNKISNNKSYTYLFIIIWSFGFFHVIEFSLYFFWSIPLLLSQPSYKKC